MELIEATSPASLKLVVHKSNRLSLNLHRKLGFEQIETRPHQVVFQIAPGSVDRWWMSGGFDIVTKSRGCSFGIRV